MARSAKSSLRSKGWLASRNNGSISAREQYRQMRSYGATATEAYGIAKAYKSATTGDYHR